ncbi:unnamed protein product [Ectocarpus sp. 12 AP-2014]
MPPAPPPAHIGAGADLGLLSERELQVRLQAFRPSATPPPPFDTSSTGSWAEGVAPEDLSSTAEGGTGVGHQGGGGGNKSSSSGGGGDGPGVTTTTKTTLLDDPDLQYSSPVVSTGGVLLPTPQAREPV